MKIKTDNTRLRKRACQVYGLIFSGVRDTKLFRDTIHEVENK